MIISCTGIYKESVNQLKGEMTAGVFTFFTNFLSILDLNRDTRQIQKELWPKLHFAFATQHDGEWRQSSWMMSDSETKK